MSNDNKPYIFVSYAHKDSSKVLPLIRELKSRGVRIWYDEGIEAGTEWPAYIEERLENCAGVIVFLSDNSIESVNCRNEVNVAAELKKEMLVAQLDDDVTYKYGMRLQLSSRQKIFCNRHNNVDSLIDEMLKLKMFEPCIGSEQIPEAHTDVHTKEKSVVPPKKPDTAAKVNPLIIGIAALALVAVIALLIVVFLPKDEEPAGDAAESTVEETDPSTSSEYITTEPEIIEMSDNLLDFTFELDGVVYRLPCSYSKFTDNGWTISSTGYSNDTIITGLDYEPYYMSKNGRRILVYSYNLSGNSLKISDCKIGGIEVALDDGAEIKLAKDITPASSVEEIKNAYGVPNDSYTASSYEQLTYWQNESEYNCVEFVRYSEGNESYIKILNFVKGPEDDTVTKTEAPDYLSTYKAPSSLGEDIYASVLSIEGDLYMLPAPVSSFVSNGWEIASKPSYVVSGGNDAITLKKGGKEMYIYIVNLAEYQTTAENCVVYKVEGSANDGIDITLPAHGKPITIGMPLSELATLLPDKFTFNEGSSYDFYNYNEYSERDFSISIMIDTSSNTVYKITVSCLTWMH